MYRECDWRGRRLLFDSTAIEKVNLTNGNHQTSDSKKNSKFIDTIGGYGYKYTHPDESDFNTISEMVFGSVAMSVRTTSLKVIDF